MHTKFWSENQKERNHLEDVECIWEGVDWMHMAQDRDQRRSVVNTINEHINGGVFTD